VGNGLIATSQEFQVRLKLIVGVQDRTGSLHILLSRSGQRCRRKPCVGFDRKEAWGGGETILSGYGHAVDLRWIRSWTRRVVIRFIHHWEE
jgi:hypothetical protein